MKKTKKMAAALALSAALAMGAVPAFAADASVGKTGSFADGNDNTGSASTALNVYATASQIQATIPVDITIVTPIEGGTITAPSADAYKIVNNNATKALKVTKVQGVDNAGWKAVTRADEPEEQHVRHDGRDEADGEGGLVCCYVHRVRERHEHPD